MGKKTITRETEAKAEVKAEVKAEAKKAAGTFVYCGPSVRGVARQYTVYTGDIPQQLEDFIKAHPIASSLIVPVERFAEVRVKLETAGSPEAILFRQIKSEL